MTDVPDDEFVVEMTLNEHEAEFIGSALNRKVCDTLKNIIEVHAGTHPLLDDTDPDELIRWHEKQRKWAEGVLKKFQLACEEAIEEADEDE